MILVEYSPVILQQQNENEKQNDKRKMYTIFPLRQSLVLNVWIIIIVYSLVNRARERESVTESERARIAVKYFPYRRLNFLLHFFACDMHYNLCGHCITA